jgi:hypothetical protein
LVDSRTLGLVCTEHDESEEKVADTYCNLDQPELADYILFKIIVLPIVVSMPRLTPKRIAISAMI